MTRYIRFLDEIGAQDLPLVGGKGANQGEMTRAGLPVPPGFCVTADAYRDFIAAAGLALLPPTPPAPVCRRPVGKDDVRVKQTDDKTAICRLKVRHMPLIFCVYDDREWSCSASNPLRRSTPRRSGFCRPNRFPH